MKYLLTLVLGLGTVAAAGCESTQTADVNATKEVSLKVTGMT